MLTQNDAAQLFFSLPNIRKSQDPALRSLRTSACYRRISFFVFGKYRRPEEYVFFQPQVFRGEDVEWGFWSTFDQIFRYIAGVLKLRGSN